MYERHGVSEITMREDRDKYQDFLKQTFSTLSKQSYLLKLCFSPEAEWIITFRKP